MYKQTEMPLLVDSIVICTRCYAGWRLAAYNPKPPCPACGGTLSKLNNIGLACFLRQPVAFCDRCKRIWVPGADVDQPCPACQTPAPTMYLPKVT
jgi:DnaJ-class molecular chaperone